MALAFSYDGEQTSPKSSLAQSGLERTLVVPPDVFDTDSAALFVASDEAHQIMTSGKSEYRSQVLSRSIAIPFLTLLLPTIELRRANKRRQPRQPILAFRTQAKQERRSSRRPSSWNPRHPRPTSPSSLPLTPTWIARGTLSWRRRRKGAEQRITTGYGWTVSSTFQGVWCAAEAWAT